MNSVIRLILPFLQLTIYDPISINDRLFKGNVKHILLMQNGPITM